VTGRRRPLLALAALAVIGTCAVAAAAPIPPGPPSLAPAFTGSPATAHPTTPTIAPQNPFLAKNPNNNIHDDTWMTDAYSRAGPLGRKLVTQNMGYPPALCGSLTFDRHGRILSVCPSTQASPPQARIIDPSTLAILATYDMPNAPDPPGTKTYQNFAGGGYFFLDQKDRIWSATKTSHIFVVAEGPGGTSLNKVGDYDVSHVLTSDERITSALPDFKGRIWFVSKKDGKVGLLNAKTRKIGLVRTGEEIENSFAVGRDAVYIVSDRRMYRFSVRRGKPHVDWKVTYRNSGIVKPSQVDAGSGTTPTLMSGGLVAITDNADPMNVVVYRTAKRLKRGQHRTVCQVPVFSKGASATENSLITAGRSLIAENNYGYQDPFGPNMGASTQPGFARVDVNKRHTGCRKVWTNTTERAPSVVPKLSTKTGLIYAYTQDRDGLNVQRWSWSTISFKTGYTVWKQLAGTGPLFNNNYAGLALGPTGTAYLGVLGGMISLRDG
jgi:hypothetical protein